MKILVEKMLCWDSLKQRATQKGVLGTVLAFMIAHEEQGRYMLHSHWQLFLKELLMELRNLLFSSNVEEKEKARKVLLAHVDKVMDSSYDVKLVKACPHGCKQENNGASVQVENVPDI